MIGVRLERNQSKRALASGIQGGFFLNRLPRTGLHLWVEVKAIRHGSQKVISNPKMLWTMEKNEADADD
jgi:hypothetical protein